MKLDPTHPLSPELHYIHTMAWRQAVAFVQSAMNWTFEKARGFVLDVKNGFVS